MGSGLLVTPPRRTLLNDMDDGYLKMRCDWSAGACKIFPYVGATIYVPSLTQDRPGHTLLRQMTTLTFCIAHMNTLKIDEFMTPKLRAIFEDFAKKTRPIDFKCDFDNSFIQYVPVASPAYRAFLGNIESRPLVINA